MMKAGKLCVSAIFRPVPSVAKSGKCACLVSSSCYSFFETRVFLTIAIISRKSIKSLERLLAMVNETRELTQ